MLKYLSGGRLYQVKLRHRSVGYYGINKLFSIPMNMMRCCVHFLEHGVLNLANQSGSVPIARASWDQGRTHGLGNSNMISTPCVWLRTL